MKHRFEVWRLLPGARRFLAELEEEWQAEKEELEREAEARREMIPESAPYVWNGLWINEDPGWARDGIDVQASAAVRDLLQAAHDELVECRRIGQARPYEGTAEIHSDGDPPIAYVIDRIERMLGRGR